MGGALKTLAKGLLYASAAIFLFLSLLTVAGVVLIILNGGTV